MLLTTNMFSYHSADKMFTAEMSTLQQGKFVNIFHRIFDDACDEGITLLSDRTGVEAKFYVDHIEQNDYDEVVEWTLLPTREAVRKSPNLKGVKIYIFNT